MRRRPPLDLVAVLALAGVCAVAYWQRPRSASAPPAATDVAVLPEVHDLPLEREATGFAGAVLNREGVELAESGRYAEAEAKLRAAQRDSPTNALVRRNLQAVLTAWGLQELARGQTRAAADRFTEALALGRQREILTGLGVAQVRLQQYGEAISSLEEALALGAGDAPTYLALGQAYEATNDRVRALEMLQRAAEAGLTAPELQARIERLAREVDAEWDFDEESSRYFHVRFDAAEDPRAAAEVLRSLEAAREVVGSKLGYFPDRPTPVVLYAEQDFHHITQTPDWAGAVFDGRLKFPVRGLTAGDELDRVTRHEYAHALIAALTHNGAPAWLNEGLAMWAEEDSPGDRQAWAEQVLERYPLQPLAALASPFSSLPPELVQAAYAQSYLTVLFLVERHDARRIPRLLEAMRHGSTLESAFADTYPLALERLEEEVAEELG